MKKRTKIIIIVAAALLAIYSTADLTESGLAVLSLYGSEDGVMNAEKYVSGKANLPAGFTEILLPGGNHAGFGNYGPQAGDGAATLSPSAQQALTVEHILAFLGE